VETFIARGNAGKLSGYVMGPPETATPPILLLHGINMSSAVWRDVAELLAPPLRVVAVDFRGHGGSDRSGPFTAEDYASDAIAVMDHFAIARAHVVGTSFGGSVACQLAARFPARVTSLVAVGSALRVEGLDVEGAVAALRGAGVRAFFAAFLPQASFAPGTDAKLVERALDMASNDRDVEMVIEISRTALASDLTTIGAAVERPALVVSGELDATCPVSAGAAMAAVLRAEHLVLPRRGHVVSLEDPAGLAELIQAFIAARGGAS